MRTETASDPAAVSKTDAPLHSLSQMVIETPCTKNWDEMKGDDVVRFCGECKRNVYNFSEMSANEAQQLVENSGDRLCGRIYRRPDGTIVTRDCGVPAIVRRPYQVSVAGLMILISASASLFAAAPWIGRKVEPYLNSWLNNINNNNIANTPMVGDICIAPLPAPVPPVPTTRTTAGE